MLQEQLRAEVHPQTSSIVDIGLQLRELDKSLLEIQAGSSKYSLQLKDINLFK